MDNIKKEPFPAKGTARIDNRDRRDPSQTNIKSSRMVSNSCKKKSPNNTEASGALSSQEDIEKHTEANLRPAPQKSNSTATVQRDASAMVFIFKRMKTGMENFEHIYGSLKRLHGPDFEKHFRDGLVSNGGPNG